jgi:hypothetical protein
MVDKVKAAQLYGQAAEQGHAPAQHNLGACYNLGQGVELDTTKAAQLLRQAAEQGHGMARWSLGLCHEHERGVPHDMGAAVALYRLAIEGGCVSASASLGLCFEEGRGVVQSPAEAERLYKLAVMSDSPTWYALPGGLSQLLSEVLWPNTSPDTPPAAAQARIQVVVYHLNLSARQGDAFADKGLELLACMHAVVSACCVGCGTVRKLKSCSKCRIARFCDTECTPRMWLAHKACCKAWRAESAGNAEQS